MSPEDQSKAIRELWDGSYHGAKEFNHYYLLVSQPMHLFRLEEKLGLHKEDTPEEMQFRIDWVNHLRTIVGRRMPKNKIGNPITSDIDLLLATIPERIEALLRATKKWRKS